MKKTSLGKKIGYLTGAMVISISLLPQIGHLDVEASNVSKIVKYQDKGNSAGKKMKLRPANFEKKLEMAKKMKERRAIRMKNKPHPTLKPTPEPNPEPAPTPVKDTYLPMGIAGKQLLATVSPNSSVSKLYSKYSNELYVATLMPSSDAQLSARYGVVYFYHNTKKATKLHINTQRYRDNKNLRANGDTAILAATDSVFGKGTNGSKQIHDFIKANINATSDTTKKMTFGGNSATVSVTKWDIQITFH